jgi:hypothetical protein
VGEPAESVKATLRVKRFQRGLKQHLRARNAMFRFDILSFVVAQPSLQGTKIMAEGAMRPKDYAQMAQMKY